MRTFFSRHGNKRNVVSSIWEHLGDPEIFIDPFFGTASVLFGRPNLDWVGRTEIINDADPHTVNFFRALKYAPEKLAIMFQAMREANHRQPNLPEIKILLGELYMKLKRELQDPGYFNLSMAAQWYWGQTNVPWQKWMAGGRVPKLHRGYLRDSQLLLWPLSRPIAEGRLRHVEIYCGDWVSQLHRLDGRPAAVFFDPPYEDCCSNSWDYYSEPSDSDLAQKVAIIAKDLASPTTKVGLCGWEGDYELPPDWSVIHGGSKNGRRRHLDRIWFSP